MGIVDQAMLVPITFPPNPTIGDIFAAPNGVSYIWDGIAWVATSSGGGATDTDTFFIDRGTYTGNIDTLTLPGMYRMQNIGSGTWPEGTVRMPCLVNIYNANGTPGNRYQEITQFRVTDFLILSKWLRAWNTTNWGVWVQIPVGNITGTIPPGGAPGTVLTKDTIQDFDAIWSTPPGIDNATYFVNRTPGGGTSGNLNGFTTIGAWNISGDNISVSTGKPPMGTNGGSAANNQLILHVFRSGIYLIQEAYEVPDGLTSNTSLPIYTKWMRSQSINMGANWQPWAQQPINMPFQPDLSIYALDDQVVHLPGDTMTGPLILSQNPTVDMGAATKLYVDALVTGARLLIGSIDADTGSVNYTDASGWPDGVLIGAAQAGNNHYVICAVAGTIPNGPAQGITMAQGDFLLSDGTNWNHIPMPTTGTVLASQVAVIPPVLGTNNVQDTLDIIAPAILPPGGATGFALAKNSATDYDVDWLDITAITNTDNTFINRPDPGGGNTLNSPNFNQLFQTGSYRIGGVPTNAPTASQQWMLNVFGFVSVGGSVQEAYELNRTAGGVGDYSILSKWMRNYDSSNGTWKNWRKIPLSAADLTLNYLPLTGGTLTGALEISKNGQENAGSAGAHIWMGGGGSTIAAWQTASGATWRWINRNDTFVMNHVTSGAPVYSDVMSIESDGVATFTNNVSSIAAPTANAHFANKAYVDALFSGAAILTGIIDASTGTVTYADPAVPSGPVPPAVGSRNYFICTTPGTIPSGVASGITMRIGDELYDNGGWILIAIGSGGVATNADLVACIPNVAGGQTVQEALTNIDAQTVKLNGTSIMTGPLIFNAGTPAVPSPTGRSSGTKLSLYPNAAANGFDMGIESGNMWFNTNTAGNGFKFYHGSVLSSSITNTGILLPGTTQLNNNAAAARKDYVDARVAKTGDTMTGELIINMAPNTNGGLRLRKNTTVGNQATPRIRFEASDGRHMGGFYGTQLTGGGYYGTWPSTMTCFVGSGGYGEQPVWTTQQQGGGFHALRVQGDVFARNVQLTSDASLKSNIDEFPTKMLDIFNLIKPKQFHWLPVMIDDPLAAPEPKVRGVDSDPDSINIGFIANEIEEVAPHLVNHNSDGVRSYDLSAMVALLWAKVQELEAKLDGIYQR